MKKRVLAIAFALLMAMSVFMPAALAVTELPRAIGWDLSEMNTTDTNGNPITSELFSKYQLTLLNYWATWCLPCKNEMPHLQKLYEKFEDMGVYVLGGLVEDDGSTVAGANALIADYGLTYPTARMDSTLKQLYNSTVSGIPDSYLIDSNGKVVAAVAGAFLTYNDLEQWVLDYYVYPDMESITIRETLELGTNRMFRLEHTIAPKYAPVSSVTWDSSDPEIASVNENGLVIGLSEGTTTITVSCVSEDKVFSDTCEVTVTESQPLADGTEYFKQADDITGGGIYAAVAHVGDTYYLMSPEKAVDNKCRLVGTPVAPEDIMLVENEDGTTDVIFLGMDDGNLWNIDDNGNNEYIVINYKTGEFLSAARNNGIYRLTTKPTQDMIWTIEDGRLNALTTKLITNSRSYLSFYEDNKVAAFDMIDLDNELFCEIMYFERAIVGEKEPAEFGDVNGNGIVDAADATMVLRCVVGYLVCSPEQLEAGDLNGNGRLDSGDAGLILRAVV